MTTPAGPRVVLDASALLAWVLRERGQPTVDALLPRAAVPASAMVETLYRAADRGHGQPAKDLHRDLLALGLRVAPLTDADTVRAADLIHTSKTRSARGSLSLGDGLVIATAERLALPITRRRAALGDARPRRSLPTFSLSPLATGAALRPGSNAAGSLRPLMVP